MHFVAHIFCIFSGNSVLLLVESVYKLHFYANALYLFRFCHYRFGFSGRR